MGLSLLGTYVHAEHDVDPDQREPHLAPEEQPFWHVQNFFFMGATVELAFAPTSCLALGGGLEGMAALYENRFDYRALSWLRGSLYAESGFGLARWTFRLGGGAFLESEGAWSGRRAENTGRVDLSLTGGAFYALRPDLEVYGLVTATPLTFTAGGQLWAPVVFVVGASADVAAFGG